MCTYLWVSLAAHFLPLMYMLVVILLEMSLCVRAYYFTGAVRLGIGLCFVKLGNIQKAR